MLSGAVAASAREFSDLELRTLAPFCLKELTNCFDATLVPLLLNFPPYQNFLGQKKLAIKRRDFWEKHSF